jgi:phage tail sheath protein FI
MPVTPTYPGVYIEEIPSGVRTIVGVATSITAFIGRARQGPTDEAITINGFGDFERTFGGLWIESKLGFAVRDFFLNGGAQAIIVRLYNDDTGDGAKPSQTKLTVGGLKLIAAQKGKVGAYLRVTVDKDNVSADVAAAMGLTKADLFNLTVTNAAPGGSSERYLNLSAKDGPRRVDRVLAAESSLVRWDGDYPSPEPTVTPAKDPVTAAADALKTKQKDLLDKQIAGTATPADTAAVETAKTALEAEQKKMLDSVSDGKALGLGNFLPANGEADKKGIYALEQVFARDGLFNILCIPPYNATDDVDVTLVSAASAYCDRRRAMLLVDPPSTWTTKKAARDGFVADPDQVGTRSRNAALFFPRLRQPNPLRDGQVEAFAPCGVVAGIFARTDTQRGVWKAPAGNDATLIGVPQLSVPLTDDENGELNPLGINCLRAFPVYGRVVWGSRTMRGADQLADEYKYIPVRRTALYIEESLYRGLKWVVFEPNDEPLWAQIRLNAGAFMHNLFRQGAFQGTTPRDAYFVKCDRETTTQNDINLGIVNVLVGFAPLKPAEFVIVKLQQMAGQIEV